jgi:hypothetical protein
MYLYIKRSFISVFKDRGMAEVVNRRPSPRRPGFDHGPLHVRLWRAEWQWDGFISECFSFPLSVSFHQRPHMYLHHSTAVNR